MNGETGPVIDSRLAQRISGGEVLVELGCGGGLALDALYSRYRCAVGVDFNLKRLENRSRPRQPWWFVVGDLNNPAPIASGCADLVLANQVIEHISDPKRFADEIFRLLRLGGTALVTTPNLRYVSHLWSLVIEGRSPKTSCPPCDLDGAWDDGHIHYFTHRDLREVFVAAGFRKVESIALVDMAGRWRWIRRFFDLFAGAYLVREFMTGNILVIARK